MDWWKIALIIYGILCIYIGLLKPPFIWKMKKFEIMKKMFKGELGVQIIVLVFGIAALLLGLLL
ncbi:MAG: hypothetical protein B6I17_01100 [Tenericutes bacterium 4572_104]|nr:MAG: hypothetical protein B6I17_01100 [Tenericutes bacterium 4572_104]